MRNVTITTNYDVYRFSELSESAKERFREWFLEHIRYADDFTDMCEENLSQIFPKSDLKVQYSLGYCQGDGLNIYGDLNLEDIFDKIKDDFTDKEQKFFRHIFSEFSYRYKMESNNHYCYCICDRYDYSEDITWDMEYANYRNIRYDLLEKFNQLARDYMSELCGIFEDSGYKYFYEVSDEELEDFAECNDYEFTDDGNIF